MKKETKSAAAAGGRLGAEEQQVHRGQESKPVWEKQSRELVKINTGGLRSEGQTHKSFFHPCLHFYLICCQLRDELWQKGGMRNERRSTVVKSKHWEKRFAIFLKAYQPSTVMVRKTICAGPGPHANIPEVDKHLSYLSYGPIIKD